MSNGSDTKKCKYWVVTCESAACKVEVKREGQPTETYNLKKDGVATIKREGVDELAVDTKHDIDCSETGET